MYLIKQSGTQTIALLVLVAVLLWIPQPAQAMPQRATVTIDLCATTGTMTMPDGLAVTIWGYALGDCTGSPAAQVPGPPLEAEAGDTVNITLHNNLSAATALNIPGMPLRPDMTGAATGASTSYSFVAPDPGTYLYEAGLTPNSQHQVAMGLYGALVVRPAGAPAEAYNATTAFDAEAVVLLSEIDPALNNRANPATFDMRNYKPRYSLINGKSYPDTAELAANFGDHTLLRYLNAGLLHHSMTVLGMRQQVIAQDGNLLAQPYTLVAETIAPGQTLDVFVDIPTADPGGDVRYALYDGGLILRNANAAGYGGMLTFLAIGGTVAGTDTVGPDTSAVTLSPSETNGINDSVAIAAQVSDGAAGNGTIAAAEYYIDDNAGTPTAMNATDGTFNGTTEAVQATITAATVATLAHGDHTIYIRGQDSAGNWGPFNFSALHIDKVGPTTSALALDPNPSDGTVAVSLSATGDDRATGNHTVVAAEYFIGAAGTTGSGTPLTPNGTSAIVSLAATLDPTAIPGTTTLYVHSQDAFGNWGDFATIELQVTTAGPVATNVTVAPNPNDGTMPINPGNPNVRVDATLDVGANPGTVAGAELFIDYQGPQVDPAGTGIPMTPGDGSYDGPVEDVYAFIPLSTIAALSGGDHTIDVHGVNSQGQWGTIGTAILTITKPPTTIGLYFSTVGNSFIPGTTTPRDDSDIYTYDNGNFARLFDASLFGVPNTADVDGIAMVSDNQFYISFNTDSVQLPGLGLVNDQDVVYYDRGTWKMFFRGSDYGFNNNARDIDAFDVTNGVLYFSLTGGASVPGVSGSNDDADIYSFDGTSFARVFDASVAGLPGNADVDGLSWHGPDDFYLSFMASTTNVPGLGAVNDENVVRVQGGNSFSLYFDGTAEGLTANGKDLDAIDVP